MPNLDDIKAWQAVAGSIVAAALVLLGRISGTRKAIRKDGAEGDLFTQLSAALKASEDRRAEEAAEHRRREDEFRRQQQENVERLLELTKQVSRVEGMLQAMERQYSDVTNALARADATNQALVHELAEYRQLFLQRLAELLPTPPLAAAPGYPATITKG